MSTPLRLTAPPSKSLSHRSLIAASLAHGSSRLSGLLESDDTKRTIDILQGCGALISRLDNGDYTITGLGGTISPQDELDCFVGESGTTSRLLTAVLAAGNGTFYFHGNGRMHERPMDELVEILSQCGVNLEFSQKKGFLPFRMRSRGLRTPALDKNDGIAISASQSSQYLSGMILAAPLSKEGLRLIFDGAGAVSKSYILLTLQTLVQHHVPFMLEAQCPETGHWVPVQNFFEQHEDKEHCSISRAAKGDEARCLPIHSLNEKKYSTFSETSVPMPERAEGDSAPRMSSSEIPRLLFMLKSSSLWSGKIRISIPPSSYEPSHIQIEGDYSGASYLLAAGALGTHPVMVSGLAKNSLQGDAAILHILERMGATVTWAEDNGHSTVTVSPGPLQGVDIDMGDCPDLVPTVAILAARATGPTTIRNIGHLALKESNRLLAPAQELAKVGCTATVSPDTVTIYPLTDIVDQTPTLSSHNDHRMAMSLALLELGNDMTIHLDNERCVDKSYPNFWRDWALLRPHSKLGKGHE